MRRLFHGPPASSKLLGIGSHSESLWVYTLVDRRNPVAGISWGTGKGQGPRIRPIWEGKRHSFAALMAMALPLRTCLGVTLLEAAMGGSGRQFLQTRQNRLMALGAPGCVISWETLSTDIAACCYAGDVL